MAHWASLAAIAGLVSCTAAPTEPRVYSVTGHVRLTGFLVAMGGEPVKTLFAGELGSGLNRALWDGLDANQLPAPGKNFWVTFVSGADERAHLVFK